MDPVNLVMLAGLGCAKIAATVVIVRMFQPSTDRTEAVLQSHIAKLQMKAAKTTNSVKPI